MSKISCIESRPVTENDLAWRYEADIYTDKQRWATDHTDDEVVAAMNCERSDPPWDDSPEALKRGREVEPLMAPGTTTRTG